MTRSPASVGAGVGLVILGVSLLTTRGLLGGGQDEEIPFISCAVLARTGGLALGETDRAAVEAHASQWEEALRQGRDGRWYSVYGPAQSWLALPLYLLGRQAAAGHPPDDVRRASEVRWCCGLNPLLTALAAGVLCLWLLGLGAPESAAIATGLGYGLATMAWPYAKTFLSEPLTALCYLLVVVACDRRRGWLAGLALVLAVLTRPHNIVLTPIFAVWAAAPRAERRWSPRAAAGVLLPVAAAAMWWVSFNLFRFGRPLDFGYLPRIQGDFSPAALPMGIIGQLFSPGRGLIWYAPPALLGLWGWRALRGRDAWLAGGLLAACAAQLAFYSLRSTWWGNWCWGPRYLMPILPLLAPLAAFGLARAPRAWAIGLAALGALNAMAGLVVYNGLYQDFIMKRFGSFHPLLWNPLWAPWIGHWRVVGWAGVDLMAWQALRADVTFGLAFCAVRLMPAGVGLWMLTRVRSNGA
jgi:hypothetical protein